MVNNLPEWHNTGVEPPNSLKVNGWQKEDRPPAQYFNWWMNRSYLALLAAKQHIDNKSNPHNVTKAQIGLNNLTNNLQATKTEFDAHIQSEMHTRYGAATGTNNISLTIPNMAAQGLVAGQAFRFKNANANTSGVTLKVNDNAAKPVLRASGTALSAGTLRIGGVYTVCYDGVNFILQGEGGEYGTATRDDVLRGKTFGTDNGVIEGSIPIIESSTRYLNAGQGFEIYQGYHDGRGIVYAESLANQTTGTALAAEIAAGKTAWVNGSRVTGTMPKKTGAITTVAAGQSVMLPNGQYEMATVQGVPLSQQTQANALAAQILAGRTAWVNGQQVTGTIPEYSRAKLGYSYVDAVSVRIDANGSMVVEPKNGYYESGLNGWGFGSIIANDPDFIAANIVAGKSIFNITGTAITGKRFATGSGWTVTGGQITVTGLGFKPSIVITKVGSNAGQLYGSAHALQTAFSSGASGKFDAFVMGGSAANGEFTSNANGFNVKATLQGEFPVHWIAIE